MKTLTWQQWLAVIAIALLPALVRVLSYADYPGADDAFIHVAVIESLWQTGTWGINPGENVNLSTSPLFTLFFAALHPLASDILRAGIWLSSAAVAGAIWFTFLLARRLGHSFAVSLFVAALAATNIHLWRWGGTFMEVSFTCLALVLVVYWFVGSRARAQERLLPHALLGMAIGALVLLRPETGLLTVALFLHDCINRQPGLIRKYAAMGMGMTLPIAAYAGWAWQVFGAVLPTTFHAKVGRGLIPWNPGVLRSEILVVGSGFIGVWLVLSAALAWSWLRPKSEAPRSSGLEAWRKHALFVLFPLLWASFYYLTMPVLQSASRYLMPALTCLPFLAGAALLSIGARADQPTTRFPRLAVMTLAGMLQLGTALYFQHTRIAPVLQSMASEYVATMTEAAAQIEARTSPDDIILVDSDIGVVSWRLAGRRVIADAGGLASPALQGMTLPEMIQSSRAKYVLHSLGTPESGPTAKNLPQLTPLWERSFRSHGVERADTTYTTRLYRVGAGG